MTGDPGARIAIPAFRVSGSPDLMQAYLTFGALTLEIGTNIKALIQKGSFGAETRYEISLPPRR
jgi:hypothetical protein